MTLTADDEMRRLARRVDSVYDRQRLHDDWTRNVQQMTSKASTPQSLWWTQYMRIAAAAVRTARRMREFRTR